MPCRDSTSLSSYFCKHDSMKVPEKGKKTILCIRDIHCHVLARLIIHCHAALVRITIPFIFVVVYYLRLHHFRLFIQIVRRLDR